MTLEQVRALVAAGESETLEFKTTTGERREAAKTLCAMLPRWQLGKHLRTRCAIVTTRSEADRWEWRSMTTAWR